MDPAGSRGIEFSGLGAGRRKYTNLVPRATDKKDAPSGCKQQRGSVPWFRICLGFDRSISRRWCPSGNGACPAGSLGRSPSANGVCRARRSIEAALRQSRSCFQVLKCPAVVPTSSICGFAGGLSSILYPPPLPEVPGKTIPAHCAGAGAGIL